MAVNPNRPVQAPNSQPSSSLEKMNQVIKTSAEAVADTFYDADKDQTSAQDVANAFGALSPQEKALLGAGTLLTGGALPAISLILEGGEQIRKAVKKAGSGLLEAVTEQSKSE